MSVKKTISFKKEKTTPGTVRYQEVPEEGQPPVVKTLYVQKWALGSEVPENLTVTIEG